MLPIFAGTLCLSALLLFWLQPMFTKMVLPLLGGSPAVWNTAMVFFQAALLAGYSYSHLTTRWLGLRRQSLLHLLILLTALPFLPIAVMAGWSPPRDAMPLAWLIGLFTVSVGLPFFAVATTAPLLQKWFAHIGHRDSTNPYFLYAASNIGSIFALLGYPVLLEPFVTLTGQGMLWAFGYGLLVVLIGVCVFLLRRNFTEQAADAKPAAAAEARSAPPDWRRRLHWMILAFAPSSLLLGATSHISTDVAAAPFLWVVPLALYLLTHVIVFSRRPILKHSWMIKAQPLFVLLVAITFFWPTFSLGMVMTMHLAAFFVTAMVCHGELARLRPATSHLTEFYLVMSLGGVLGGAFNGLLAPVLFDSVVEYPLMIVLACMLRPAADGAAPRWRAYDLIWPLALCIVMLIYRRWFEAIDTTLAIVLWTGFYVIASLVAYSFNTRPYRFGLGVSAILLSGAVVSAANSNVLLRERSFFGVHQVLLDKSGTYNVLKHGTTMHGAQFRDPSRRREAVSYYHRAGPLGQAMAAFADGPPKRTAVIGLGTGALACYRRPGEKWTFYEIDPVVASIARDTPYFTYMSDCADNTPVVLGDGRITLAQADDGSYDRIIIDAFSSDSIPAHLLTREALALYLEKLSVGGVILAHISNRYLNLEPVLANLAADAGIHGFSQTQLAEAGGDERVLRSGGSWVVLARSPDTLAALADRPDWHALERQPRFGVWTDDFTNIISVLVWWRGDRD